MKFGSLNLKSEESHHNSEMKILHKDAEEQLNLNSDLERYLQDNEIMEGKDPEAYIKNNLEKNDKLREEIKQQKRIVNENLVEKDLINKLLNSNKADDVHLTPEKKIGHDSQINNSNNQENMPGLPSHITGSMRKIRNSPALAENEQIQDMQNQNNDSPNSIIPNPYDENIVNEDTAMRVNNSTPPQDSQIELQAQNPYGVEEDESDEFKPDPNLLERLNANMRK